MDEGLIVSRAHVKLYDEISVFEWSDDEHAMRWLAF